MEPLGDVPEIDLDDALSSDPTRRDRAARAVRLGFGELGLVAVRGHTLGADALERFHAVWERFCARPDTEKSEVLRPDLGFQRGWTPPATERAVAAGGDPDLKEGYFAAPLPLDAHAAASWPALLCDNVWPVCEPDLDPALTAVGRALHTAGQGVLGAAERALGLDAGDLVDLTHGAPHLTRALRYLPLTEAEVNAGALWGEEHTDFNLLTVLGGGRFVGPDGRAGGAPDAHAGLYLRTRQGRVVRGQAAPGCLVAQVGQELEVLTGGTFLATPHGIRAPRAPGWSRLSLAHFVHVHPDRTLAPLSPFATPAALEATRPPTLAGLWALKTLVDIGLAPPEVLGWLTRPVDARLRPARPSGSAPTT